MTHRPRFTPLLVLLALAACSKEKSRTAGLAADSTGTLTALEWAGYEDTVMYSTFRKKYPKVTVNVSFGESDADVYGKMKANADACVFHFYTGWQNFYVTDGLVMELDTTRLSNWSQVPARFKALGQVNGKQYYVP